MQNEVSTVPIDERCTIARECAFRHLELADNIVEDEISNISSTARLRTTISTYLVYHFIAPRTHVWPLEGRLTG